MDWADLIFRLQRLSLFRWRIEWVLLACAAVGLVMGEQAREALGRDPYLLHAHGRTAAATIFAARETVVDLGVRRGEQRTQVRTLLDLQWFDENGERRLVENYRLPPETAAALGIAPSAQRGPRYVNIQYLTWPSDVDAAEATALQPGLLPNDATAPAFQGACRPRPHCRLVILLPATRTASEAQADFVDLAIVWAPRVLWWGLGAFLLLLALRFTGWIDNRPSLE